MTPESSRYQQGWTARSRYGSKIPANSQGTGERNMPVSKSKRGQKRKENQAKAAGGFGGGGVSGRFDRTPQPAPATTQPSEGLQQLTSVEDTPAHGKRNEEKALQQRTGRVHP